MIKLGDIIYDEWIEPWKILMAEVNHRDTEYWFEEAEMTLRQAVNLLKDTPKEERITLARSRGIPLIYHLQDNHGYIKECSSDIMKTYFLTRKEAIERRKISLADEIREAEWTLRQLREDLGCLEEDDD